MGVVAGAGLLKAGAPVELGQQGGPQGGPFSSQAVRLLAGEIPRQCISPCRQQHRPHIPAQIYAINLITSSYPSVMTFWTRCAAGLHNVQ